tara:strand:+ start:286 stop:900 length:615 start_codon:yes stop_codon:yes gene_type:complete
MAEYCNEAYENSKYNYGVRQGEFSYTVKQDSGISIIVFRGTNNVKNIISDIDMRPFKDDSLGGVYIHRGYRDAAVHILNDIDKEYKLEKTVYLTGHSLGGAIAQIVGLWLDQRGHYVQIYTFGSPKISTTFFGNIPEHYRVAFDNDPVPFFPPYPFLHSGIYIDPETLDWNEGHEEISFLEINANDHSIAEYVNILKKRLEDGN